MFKIIINYSVIFAKNQIFNPIRKRSSKSKILEQLSVLRLSICMFNIKNIDLISDEIELQVGRRKEERWNEVDIFGT